MKNLTARQSITSVCILAVSIAMLFASCKKETTQKACGKTMSEVAGTYSFVKIEASTGGAFSDITSLMDPCVIDNKIILNTDGTADYHDAGMECSGGSGTGGSGHWTINPDGKLLINVGTINFSDADVTSFDCSGMVFTEEDDNVNYRSTLKR